MESAKQILQEIVILPSLRPEVLRFFSQILSSRGFSTLHICDNKMFENQNNEIRGNIDFG